MTGSFGKHARPWEYPSQRSQEASSLRGRPIKQMIVPPARGERMGQQTQGESEG